jgi:hypothetical protein
LVKDDLAQRIESTETRTLLQQSKSNKRSAYSKFSYAISSEQTRDYYFRKLKVFLQYLDIPKDPFEDGVNQLYTQIEQKGIDWFTESLIDFIVEYKLRIVKKEITA